MKKEQYIMVGIFNTETKLIITFNIYLMIIRVQIHCVYLNYNVILIIILQGCYSFIKLKNLAVGPNKF